MELLGLLLRQK